jgi:hypothetical protein
MAPGERGQRRHMQVTPLSSREGRNAVATLPSRLTSMTRVNMLASNG